MTDIRDYRRSFNGGIVAPEFYGQIADNKFQTGLADARNFWVLPHGPVANRPGTQFVRKVGDSTKETRVINFTYSTTQTMVVEMGEGYFRFHTAGATLLPGSPAAYSGATAYVIGDMVTSAGTTYYCIAATTGNAPPNATYWYAMPASGEYEIPNPFAEADLFDIHFVQSQDVLTLVHPGYAPRELRRYGATNWQMATITFESTLDPPTNVTAARTASQTKTITNITQAANALVTTSSNHGLSTNDVVLLENVSGMIEVNDLYFTITKYSATKFYLNVNSSGYTAYSSGGTATPGDGAFISHTYKVTSVGEDGREESLASSSDTITNDLLTTGNSNTITWTAATGAIRYNVYKESGGLYGYVGQSDGTSFVDDNIEADLSKTLPIADDPFTGAGDYPGAVSYFEQRRVFAGTTNQPQNFWMTRTGTENNLSYSIPSLTHDAVRFQIAALQSNTIRHLVPLTSLVALTSSTEWNITSYGNSGVTPDDIDVKPQSYVGASNVQPVLVNNNILFEADEGGHIHELAYSWQASGYVTGDLSVRAPHLFDGYSIRDMIFSKAPYPIVYMTSTSGDLIGLTYMPGQQIGAFHRHDTYTNAGDASAPVKSTFESVTAVSESGETIPYFVVKRTIDGATVRYIERLHTRQFATLSDCFFVDCGLTYDGAATTSITGLDHLEGETVSILADGAVCAQATVASGAITLAEEASVVHVGLPIEADVETLPLALQIDGFAQGRKKNISRAHMRVVNSSSIKVGPAFDKLTPWKQRTNENYGSPPALYTGEMDVLISPNWQKDGKICVRQSNPLPLTIANMTLEVAIGG